jgi:hypothetical protein
MGIMAQNRVTFNQAEENIFRFYDRATREDIESGLAWYVMARRWCQWTGRDYGFNWESVAGALAALSPLVRWEWNLDCTKALVKGIREGVRHADQIHLPGPATTVNKTKAIRILLTGDIGYLSGSKVESFYDNITNPASLAVTVDQWAYRAAIGDVSAVVTWIYPAKYRRVAEKYRKAAGRLDLMPFELQAIVWIVVRKLARMRADFVQLPLL